MLVACFCYSALRVYLPGPRLQRANAAAGLLCFIDLLRTVTALDMYCKRACCAGTAIRTDTALDLYCMPAVMA